MNPKIKCSCVNPGLVFYSKGVIWTTLWWDEEKQEWYCASLHHHDHNFFSE
jgi:hypothetical protein